MRKIILLKPIIAVILLVSCASVSDIRNIPKEQGVSKYYDAPAADVLKAAEMAVSSYKNLKKIETMQVQSDVWVIIAEIPMTAIKQSELLRITVEAHNKGATLRVLARWTLKTVIVPPQDYSGDIFKATDLFLAQLMASKVQETQKVNKTKEAEEKSDKSDRKQEIIANEKQEEPQERAVGPLLNAGTGFPIGINLLVTAAHIVEEADSILVYKENLPQLIQAKLLSIDTANDVAILAVDYEFQKNEIFTLSDETEIGENVYMVGYPLINTLGSKPRYSEGVISAKYGIGDDPRFLQITVPIQPGNSGGPLLNHDGSVIGMVSHKLNESYAVKASGSIPQNVNFAIKSGYISLLAKNTDRWERPTGIVKSRAIEDSVNSVVIIITAKLQDNVPEQTAQNVKELYTEGYEALKKGNTHKAREKFHDVLSDSPDNEYVVNTYFWIAESYYKDGNYEDAILSYEEVLKKNPQSNKVPISLLKQGLAFYALKDEMTGRIILEKLIRSYPDSEQATIARKKIGYR